MALPPPVGLLPEQESLRPRLTNKKLFVLGSMNMIDCINTNLLTPYVDSMVSEFLDTTPDDPAVAHYVGLLIGLYSFCEVIFSPIWGTFSDVVGRKPALLIGLAGSVVAPILFGLGTNMTTVFLARALDGFFCGNIGITKTYLGEIVDETNEAKGFSILATAFSAGLFIGPMLGGQLVWPAKWGVAVFAGTIFDKHPFLLPNLTYAIFGALAWIVGLFFLEETLPRQDRASLCCCRSRRARDQPLNRSMSSQSSRSQNSGNDPLGVPRIYTPPATEAVQDGRVGENGGPPAPVLLPAGKWALVQVIIAYCSLSGWSSAAGQLFVLIVSLPASIHGFALGPQEIGWLQNVSAAVLLLNQLFVYKPLVARVGLFYVVCIGWTICNTGFLLFPVYAIFIDHGFAKYIALGVLQVMNAMGGGLLFPTSFTLINRASQGMARGAVNGWANSSGALCRAIFPPAASVVLTWGSSLNDQWGRYVAIYVLCALGTLLMVVAAPGIKKVSATSIKPPQRQATQRS